MIAHLINKFINFIFKKRHKTSNVRVFKEELSDIFKDNGEGISYINIKGVSNNFVAKQIEKYSGDLTHCAFTMYSENMRDNFTRKQWKIIQDKWKFYYGNLDGLDECKCLVLSSADSSGMNFCSMARYQHRQFSLRKPKLTKKQQSMIINWLLKDENVNCYYDYVGLAFWVVNRWLRKFGFKKGIGSKSDYFCSEQLHEGFRYIGINLFPDFDNPSPLEVEQVKPEWVVYKTDKFPY